MFFYFEDGNNNKKQLLEYVNERHTGSIISCFLPEKKSLLVLQVISKVSEIGKRRKKKSSISF